MADFETKFLDLDSYRLAITDQDVIYQQVPNRSQN